MNKRTVLLLTLLCALALSACGGGGNASDTTSLAAVPADYAGKVNPYANNADAIAAGKATYDSTCASCHGAGGLGDGAAGAALTPPPANLVTLQKTAEDDYLFWRIAAGKEGTAMVAWNNLLDDEQIWQVVSYIHTLK